MKILANSMVSSLVNKVRRPEPPTGISDISEIGVIR